jgi:integrase
MGKHGEGTLYKKRGKGCWRVRWMFNGTLHDENTGTEDIEKARKIARQKTACSEALGDVRALTARLEKAKDEQTVLEARTNPSLNLNRMVAAFRSCDIVRRKRNTDSTMRSWNNYGNLLINRFGGNTEMRQLTREQVEEFMRDYETKVSGARFNGALQFFKRVWSVLSKYDSPTELKARLTSESPWEYILPMKKGEVVGKKPFTPEQLNRIWRVLEEINDPDLTLLFDLARNTGARLHDLVSWKWDEHLTFSLENGKPSATLEWKPLKTANSTGKLMVIPILDERVVVELWKRSKARKVGQEYILPRMLEMYNKNKACALTKLCQSVFIKAGIETTQKVEGNSRANCVYGMHSFRHTLVSELFKKGVDLGTIQHLYTGHGSSYVTELYAHADMDKKKIDLSNLTHIETARKEPTRIDSFLSMLNEEDKEEYDRIKLMDVSKPIQTELVSLLKFKSKKELETIRDWIDKRIGGLI